MSERKELRKLSKSQLIDEIIFLRERLNKIEHYLKAFDNAHTPSSMKLKNNTKDYEPEQENSEKDKDEEKKKPRFPGKPQGSKDAGRI